MSQYNVFAGEDSEDEDKLKDEALTDFDSDLFKRKEKDREVNRLVIPSQANVDWREKKSKSQRYRPNQEQQNVQTITQEKLNDAPERAGLQTADPSVKREKNIDIDDIEQPKDQSKETHESLDDKALKSLLNNEKHDEKGEEIDAIPMTAPGLSDSDAFKADVAARADESTIDEYERVPVHQFGAALLRGMGWKEGTAASRTRTGPTEPYLPDSRPALLGIGASARPTNDSDKKTASGDFKIRKQEMTTYRPLTKQSRQSSSSSVSRSPSPPSRELEKMRTYSSSSRDYDRDKKPYDKRDDRYYSRRYDDRRDDKRYGGRDDYKRSDRRYDERRYDEKRYDSREYDRKKYY
ncbi:hypothetical protein E3Q16_02285 [Wallemia mellicola]|nr:hypothetical protein E3Q16_02285 [Wallemia mellicola]